MQFMEPLGTNDNSVEASRDHLRDHPTYAREGFDLETASIVVPSRSKRRSFTPSERDCA